MPKIIDNPQKRILDATREEIFKEGLEDFKMRDVAKRSGIGVGTIYHYYPDKLTLIASIVAEDWVKEVASIQEKIDLSFSFEESIKYLHDGILNFRFEEKNIFQQVHSPEFSVYYFKNHVVFLNQISKIMDHAMDKFHYTCDDETKTIIASIIVESTKGRFIPYDALIKAVMKLVNKA